MIFILNCDLGYNHFTFLMAIRNQEVKKQSLVCTTLHKSKIDNKNNNLKSQVQFLSIHNTVGLAIARYVWTVVSYFFADDICKMNLAFQGGCWLLWHTYPAICLTFFWLGHQTRKWGCTVGELRIGSMYLLLSTQSSLMVQSSINPGR